MTDPEPWTSAGFLAACRARANGDSSDSYGHISWPMIGRTLDQHITELERELAEARERRTAETEERTAAERTQFLRDIMCTAIEGGVGYWSAADDIEREYDPEDQFGIGDYVSFVLYCTDGGREPVDCGNRTDDPCQGHRIDADGIERGLRIMREDRDDIGWHRTQRAHVIAAELEGDAGEIDAWDADCIVQLAAFGTVIYG